PQGKDAENVPEVRFGLEIVEPALGDEAEEAARGLGMLIAPDEEPRLATDGDVSKLAFGDVVVELEAAVVEEPLECVLLTACIAQGGAKKATLMLVLEPVHLD